MRTGRESRVYVVQDPQGKNIAPAREYGEIEIILRGNENNSHAIEKLAQGLRDMTHNDFLLLIGNPVFIGIAFHFATQYVGKEMLRLLVWDQKHYKYNVERIEL